MTVGTEVVTLKNFNDVLKQGYNVYVTGGTIYEAVFKNALPNSIMNEVYQKSLFVDELEGAESKTFQLDKMSDGGERNAVFSSYYTFLDEPRRTKILMDFHDKIEGMLGFTMQKDSEFLDCFNYHINSLQEQGILQQLQFKWMEQSAPDDISNRIFVADAQALGYNNLFFPTSLLIGGILGAGMIFAAENFKKRFVSPPIRLPVQQYYTTNNA